MPFDQIDCLESALTLLEDVNHNFIIQQEDYNSVKTALKELVSVHFISIYMIEYCQLQSKSHFIMSD